MEETAKEKAERICNEMAEVAEKYLPLKRWGFNESVHVPYYKDRWSMEPTVIYNSEWCKLSISFREWVHPYSTKYRILVTYGRLHAPDSPEGYKAMTWNGERCHPWHHSTKTLHFLDGCSPEYTAKERTHKHKLITKYRQDTKGKGYSSAEWTIRKEAMIWEHYAPRIFELFDLRRPKLWEEYRTFLKEVYRIRNENSPNPIEHSPPFWQVC